MAIKLKDTEECKENYMPPEELLRHSLGTKKEPYAIDSLELPGLLDYNEGSVGLLLFPVCILLEVLGLIVLTNAGLAWIAALALFVVDVFFAIIRHLPEGKITLLKNQLIVETFNPNKKKIRTRIRLWKSVQWVASFFIAGIALFKIVGFLGFVGQMNASVLFIIVTYIMVAIIHITWTGYFLWYALVEIEDYFAHLKYRRKLDEWCHEKREHISVGPAPCVGAPNEIKNPVRSDSITIPGLSVPGYVVERHVFINDTLVDEQGGLPRELFKEFDDEKVLNDPILCNNHIQEFLAKQKVDKDDNKYVLFTWGVFTDRHLNRMVNLIPVENKREELAKAFLKHQIGKILNLTVGVKTNA